MPNAPLWRSTAENIASSNMQRYILYINQHYSPKITSQETLYTWSISSPQQFWESIWNFCGVIYSKPYQSVLESHASILETAWFKGAELNFAENLLRKQGSSIALSFYAENLYHRKLSYAELYQNVTSLAAYFKSVGIKAGDRVVGVMPNLPETVTTMLATSSIGAVWASVSPDFGVEQIVDRFGQLDPKLIIGCDCYYYRGKKYETINKLAEVKAKISSIKSAILVSYSGQAILVPAGLTDTVLYDQALKKAPTITSFQPLPFSAPLYIMFSSGTTGKPKCIIHSAGGTLIEHLKELILHTDLKPEDTIFYQTTCSWMMWNWLVSSLAVGAKIILYDGSPLEQAGEILFELAEKEEITIFGTNAKYLALIEKMGLIPKEKYKLSKLRIMLSTGSPLAPESFDYVYQSIKSNLQLSSISGGTDILGCFALGTPISPVYRGQLQTRSLGLKVEVFDQNGRAVTEQKGELVCTAPFPSMPIGFWGDTNNELYKKAYFSRYPNVWHHADLVELKTNGGMIFYGRSDNTLNPGGVRIGSAEIYRQVEKLPEVLESLAVGQDWESDQRIVLFVVLQDNLKLDAALTEKICHIIKTNTSVHHVPKKIIQAPDLPRTKNGKLSESAVREAIHGRSCTNLGALANPEVLKFFLGLEELAN